MVPFQDSDFARINSVCALQLSETQNKGASSKNGAENFLFCSTFIEYLGLSPCLRYTQSVDRISLMHFQKISINNTDETYDFIVKTE